MGGLSAGAAVFLVLSALLYFGARLAPQGRSEAELEQIRSARGDRAAERFRQMDQQRTYTVRVGKVMLPVAAALFIVALGADLVR